MKYIEEMEWKLIINDSKHE